MSVYEDEFINHLTYSKYRVPIVGALMDYIENTYLYLQGSSEIENFQFKIAKAKLSATFLTGVCLVLGLICNIKFETVTVSGEPLARDLPSMLMHEDYKLEDVDFTRVMWCIEASDCMVILISCLLIWCSSNLPSSLSEHVFAPWLGATARGLATRQTPTALALLYTTAAVKGHVDPLFLFIYVVVLLLEVRLWLEVARLLWCRWQCRCACDDIVNFESSARNGDLGKGQETWVYDNANATQSVEMRNHMYH